MNAAAVAEMVRRQLTAKGNASEAIYSEISRVSHVTSRRQRPLQVRTLPAAITEPRRDPGPERRPMNRRKPTPLQRSVNRFVAFAMALALALCIGGAVMWGIAESEECRIFVADGMPGMERRMP